MRERNRRGLGDGVLRGTTAGPTDESNGVRPEGMRTRPVPFDEVIDEPIDLVAVQADDELINALSAGMAVSAPGFDGYDRDDRVVAMLAAWKAEVDAEPIPQLLDYDTAARAVVAGRSSSRRARHLVPLAGAAALIVFAVTGVSLGANVAQPGDTLWAVTKVLYSERAESVEAAAGVQARLERVRTALATGQTETAREELAAIEADLGRGVVRAEEGLTELMDEQQFLEATLEETPLDTPIDPQLLTRPPAAAETAPGTTEESNPADRSNPGGSEDSSQALVPDPESPDAPDATRVQETPPPTPPEPTPTPEPTPSPPPASPEETPTPPPATGEGQTDPPTGDPQPPVAAGPAEGVADGAAEGTVDETTAIIGFVATPATLEAAPTASDTTVPATTDVTS